MIATVMPPPGEPIPGMRPHLVLRVKPGWRFDARANAFVDTRGRRCPEAEALPPGTRILPVSPALPRKRAVRMTAPERDLARYFQVVLPLGTNPHDWLVALKRWPCAAEASLPPAISLPQGA